GSPRTDRPPYRRGVALLPAGLRHSGRAARGQLPAVRTVAGGVGGAARRRACGRRHRCGDPCRGPAHGGRRTAAGRRAAERRPHRRARGRHGAGAGAEGARRDRAVLHPGARDRGGHRARGARGGARARALTGIDVAGGLRHLLPWPEAADLAHLAPERLAVPSGSTARIDYPDPAAEDGRPVVAVKLQEVFGLAETPRLVRGRVPVLFHLLSPARRPLAVTDALRSFWDGPYQDVRREMRGRYPKHPWPEDPWTAPATARTSRGARRGGG